MKRTATYISALSSPLAKGYTNSHCRHSCTRRDRKLEMSVPSCGIRERDPCVSRFRQSFTIALQTSEPLDDRSEKQALAGSSRTSEEDVLAIEDLCQNILLLIRQHSLLDVDTYTLHRHQRRLDKGRRGRDFSRCPSSVVLGRG